MAANITTAQNGQLYALTISGVSTVFACTTVELSTVLAAANLQNFVYINLWNSSGIFQYLAYVNTANVVMFTPTTI